MAQSEVVGLVAAIAAGQWGMFTTAQAESAGVPRAEVARLIRRGLARRVRHGVHIMAGVPSTIEEIRAEWLAVDPGRTAGERRNDEDQVVVSDESAAAVYGIGDLAAGGVHLTAVRRLQPRQRWVTTHRREIGPLEYRWVDGLPVTTPRRTLEDLAQSGRWESDQLRDLVADAINQGLIEGVDLAKSVVLARALPEMAVPVSHAAVRQRLANHARANAMDPGDVYNAFFRMLFIGALMEHDGWVLKGGTGLLCRMLDARATRDLDLFRDGDREVAVSASALHGLMDGRIVGRYAMRVGQPTFSAGDELEVARLKVTVVDGATAVASFNIDLSAAVVLNAEPDLRVVGRGDDAVLAGYPSTLRVRLYPIENQIADKLCAMYSTFGSGPSTRYRDLYDLAMIAERVRFDPHVLEAALRAQQQIRKMVIPVGLPDPASAWANAYGQQLRRAPGAKQPFTSYAAAIAKVKESFGGIVAVASLEKPSV